MDRREKIYSIPERDLIEILRPRGEIVGDIRAIYYDYQRMTFNAICVDPSFEIVEPGCVAPMEHIRIK